MTGPGAELQRAIAALDPALEAHFVAPFTVVWQDADVWILARRGDVVLFASLDDERCGVAVLARDGLHAPVLYDDPAAACAAFEGADPA